MARASRRSCGCLARLWSGELPGGDGHDASCCTGYWWPWWFFLVSVCSIWMSWSSMPGWADAGGALREGGAPQQEALRGASQHEEAPRGASWGKAPLSASQQEAPWGASRREAPRGSSGGGPSAGGLAARREHYYTVCNEVADQMLGHAGNIAFAISKRKAVMIPDVFIVDGVNTETFTNTMPTSNNVVPFGDVFDIQVLLQKIAAFGIEAKIVPHDVSVHGQLGCAFLPVLSSAEAAVVKDVLRAMVPSTRTKAVLDSIQAAMTARLPKSSEQLLMSNAICLHHPDSDRWHRRCDHWERLSKTNNNCRSKEPISELVDNRISHLRDFWIFYVGDHGVDADLESFSREKNIPVITREQVHPASEVMQRFTEREPVPPDILSVLDYFLCSEMAVFIGNSVSLWSASQIVIRDTVASWYNSFGIPLADILKGYTVPLVYTYTEESSASGKVLLKISILSVKKTMPTASIHIVYHGKRDADLRSWLIKHGVVLYDHQPTWRDKIEKMRLKGNVLASHLYASSGNYLGTWQRIDLPLFLSTEYCILLDSDTLVVQPFTIADLGKSLPRGLAFSSELNEDDGMPSNAGVALLNIPFLRKSMERFHSFVLDHDSPNFDKGPSDQGAYLSFYDREMEFLSTRFNMKPYYRNQGNWEGRFILHYHGLKPNDHIQYWFSGTCDPLKCFLIFLFEGAPYQCDAMVDFAKAAAFEGPDLIEQYCDISAAKYSNHCAGLLGLMASHEVPGQTCTAYCAGALTQRGLDPLDFPYIQQ